MPASLARTASRDITMGASRASSRMTAPGSRPESRASPYAAVSVPWPPSTWARMFWPSRAREATSPLNGSASVCSSSAARRASAASGCSASRAMPPTIIPAAAAIASRALPGSVESIPPICSRPGSPSSARSRSVSLTAVPRSSSRLTFPERCRVKSGGFLTFRQFSGRGLQGLFPEPGGGVGALLVERLVLQQGRHDAFELVAVLAQDADGVLVALVHDAPRLLVHDGEHGGRGLRLLPVAGQDGERADLLRHAPAAHHA